MIESQPLVIICYGDSKNGFGHIRRAASLCNFFSEENKFIKIIGLSDESNELLASLVSSQKILNFDLQEIINSKILIDSPLNFDDLAIRLRKGENQIITMDYFGELEPDINIVIYPHESVSGVKTYIGFDYVIIRKEFLEFSKILKQESHADAAAVIILGGGDVLEQSSKAAKKLLEIGYSPTIIYGPTKSKESLIEINAVTSLCNPKNYPKLIFEADLIISNCGGCMFESLFLNKPTFLLPQTDKEESIAKALFKSEELIVGMGMHNLSSLNPDTLTFKNPSSDSVIDGKGLQRISNILIGSYD